MRTHLIKLWPILLTVASLSFTQPTMAQVTTDSSSTMNTQNQTSTVDINSADINSLVELPGIGPSKAQSIIDYRDINGAFRTIEEIINVQGIGPALSARILPLISVTTSAMD